MLNKGWFIPALIAGAAACTVAFWFYLNTDSEPIAARFTRPADHQHANKYADATPAANSTLPRLAASDAIPPINKSLPSPPPTAASIAESPEDTLRETFAVQTYSVMGPPAELSESSPIEPTVHPPLADIATTITANAESTDISNAPIAAVSADRPNPKSARTAALRPLRDRFERYFLTRLDDLDFLAMELDRNAVRWRSNLSRDPWLITLAAWLQYNAGDVDGADRTFLRAISLRPDDLAALRGRAWINMEAGRFAQAASAYRDLCRTYPNDADAHYNHGVLLSRVGRLGDAASAFGAALAVDPRHSRSIYNLAAIAQHDGRLSEARRLWEAFTEIEPNVISVWFNLGVVHMDYNEPLDAARCFEAAVSINPSEVVGRINLALAYMEAGHVEEADLTLQSANEDAPCTPAVLDALIETNRRLAEWSRDNRAGYLAQADAIESELFDMRPADMVYERIAGDPTHNETAGLAGP
ncbi:MAG: tetratricopeptide repeat protein [Phycisphaerales bacterium]|nr:tetratricopeptide repeat protein [Phycisphaerales bacterium]